MEYQIPKEYELKKSEENEITSLIKDFFKGLVIGAVITCIFAVVSLIITMLS